MFKLAVLSLPVAILPILAVQAVESLMTHAVLPDLAASMQRAAAGEPSEVPAVIGMQRAETGPYALGIALPTTLRF